MDVNLAIFILQHCFNCRKSGHVLSQCPKANKQTEGTGICFKCGSMNHMSRFCKVKTKGQGMCLQRSLKFIFIDKTWEDCLQMKGDFLCTMDFLFRPWNLQIMIWIKRSYWSLFSKVVCFKWVFVWSVSFDNFHWAYCCKLFGKLFCFLLCEQMVKRPQQFIYMPFLFFISLRSPC